MLFLMFILTLFGLCLEQKGSLLVEARVHHPRLSFQFYFIFHFIISFVYSLDERFRSAKGHFASLEMIDNLFIIIFLIFG